ncbi:flagellar motor protein MotB [Burkholderia territorii]|uniref:Flagellar motor protein MotB n=1 Tax=Burkholderia territorii TaxID=1503055 RepID=A0A105W2A6_9BURK|nr:OmpA family protein [Burkholderia territorii]KVV58315.1 flagellar motor protein MotB [Burkholderia territorii]KVX28280.1 flagellar motor protein MotB [Burkholderia territorii]
MFGTQIVVKRGSRDEAEKPFWISFADLMTALMVLFLVVMGVALLAVTKNVTEKEKREEQHRKDIELILDRFQTAAKRYDGIKIDRNRHVIDFGDRARFAFGKSNLTPEQEAVLRQFVPEILTLANDDLGKRVLKRVVVEGYTDRTGTYLSNLNLSLQRSERVLCSMFATTGTSVLDEAQKLDVRNLFLVGGYSFNDSKETDEESRRVEMRLEFLGVGEDRSPAPAQSGNFGDCALR